MLYKSREAVATLFNVYFLILCVAKCKSIHGEIHKVLTLKQILQRLSIPLAQVKVCNTSENVLNGIRKIIYSLHRAIEINESNKVIKQSGYMNSKNSGTSTPHRLLSSSCPLKIE